MKALAFDCSTLTGWAFSDEATRIESGAVGFVIPKGQVPGHRFIDFRQWLRCMIATYQPDVCFYEQAHHRGGAATTLCVGFTTRVEEECARAGVPCKAIQSRHLKKWATGNGNAQKPQMAQAAADLYAHYDPQADKGANEADALLLLACGLDEQENPCPTPTKPASRRIKKSTARKTVSA